MSWLPHLYLNHGSEISDFQVTHRCKRDSKKHFSSFCFQNMIPDQCSQSQDFPLFPQSLYFCHRAFNPLEYTHYHEHHNDCEYSSLVYLGLCILYSKQSAKDLWKDSMSFQQSIWLNSYSHWYQNSTQREVDRKRLESLQSSHFKILDIEIKSPNNPARLLKAKLISYAK